MAGISSKALNFGDPQNRRKYNGIEETVDLGLNQYDAFFRNADPQIGRWWQLDPIPNTSESPYSMMENNPLSKIDPLGDTAVVRWRTGFLGLGKRKEARYVDGQWINSKNREKIDISTTKKGVQRLMNNYENFNSNSAFDKVTNKINSHSDNIVFVNSRKNITDPNGKYRNGRKSDLNVKLSESKLISSDLTEGQESVKVNSQILMAHEMGHVFDILNGKDPNFFTSIKQRNVYGTFITIASSEINAMFWENIARLQAGLPLRTNYAYSGGGYGKTNLLNNNAIINTDGKFNPISIGDLDGNTYPVNR